MLLFRYYGYNLIIIKYLNRCRIVTFLLFRYEIPNYMIKETSPTAIYEAFMRPIMTKEYVQKLLTNVYDAAYAKGFKDSDRGHEIIEAPEYRLTEQLRFPVKIEPQLREHTRKNNLDNLQWPQQAKVVELYVRRQGAIKRSVNSK